MKSSLVGQSPSIHGIWLQSRPMFLQTSIWKSKPSNWWNFLPNRHVFHQIVPTYLKMVDQTNVVFLIAIIKNLSPIKVRSNIKQTFRCPKVVQTWKEWQLIGRNRHQAFKSRQIPFEGLYRQQFLRWSAYSFWLPTFPQKVWSEFLVPSNFPKSWANRIQAWLSDLNFHLPAVFALHLLFGSPSALKGWESAFQSVLASNRGLLFPVGTQKWEMSFDYEQNGILWPLW